MVGEVAVAMTTSEEVAGISETGMLLVKSSSVTMNRFTALSCRSHMAIDLTIGSAEGDLGCATPTDGGSGPVRSVGAFSIPRQLLLETQTLMGLAADASPRHPRKTSPSGRGRLRPALEENRVVPEPPQTNPQDLLGRRSRGTMTKRPGRRTPSPLRAFRNCGRGALGEGALNAALPKHPSGRRKTIPLKGCGGVPALPTSLRHPLLDR